METSLTSLVGMLTQALKLHSTFPALCLLVLNWLVFVSYLEEQHKVEWWTNLEQATQVTLIVLLALLVGYTLDSFNFVLLGLFESEGLRSTWWGKLIVAWQRRQLHIAWQRGDDQAPVPRIIQPTRLGNELNAGKARIQRRYGIDAVYLWPHLMSVLSEKGYAAQVEREKATFDFFLNLSVLSAAFVGECVLARVLLGCPGSALVPWAAMGMAYVFYRLAVPYARKWYDWINAAFDLYRYKLAERLALKPFVDEVDEMQKWKDISYFIKRSPWDGFRAFRYSLPDKKEVEVGAKVARPEAPSGEVVKGEEK